MEYWSGGVLEWWSTGVVEYWSGGVLEWWSTGVVEYWSGGVLEKWSIDFSFIVRSNIISLCIIIHQNIGEWCSFRMKNFSLVLTSFSTTSGVFPLPLQLTHILASICGCPVWA